MILNNTRIIPPLSLSSFPPIFTFPNPTLSPQLPSSSSSNFHLFRSFHLRHNSFLKVTRAIDANEAASAVEDDDADDDLVIEASITRILPPALTLEHGLQSLKNELEHFRLHPPSSDSGFIRFQVAVPPGANALDWFCCQPESSGVFPQFYMSKQSENPTPESAFFSKTRGVFGIGAAVSFRYSPSNSDEWNSFRRYLLVDTLNVIAYGFIGINYDIKSSFTKNDTGSFSFIIPQIELNECEGFNMLAGTLVWCNSFLCNFEQALHSYEISLLQALNNFPAALETSFANFMESTIQKFNMAIYENLELVYMEGPVLGSYKSADSILEMVSSSS